LTTLAILFAIVLLAFTVEAVLGFGSTVLAVTLGAQVLPLDALLPAFVPLNLALSLYLVARHGRLVELRLLFRRVLPFVAVGMAVGLALFRLRAAKVLELGLAVFVVGLAALELGKLLFATETRPRPLARLPGAAVLALGGVAHGLFGAGGPMVVYFAGRELTDKGRFRATLSALWLVLNAALLINYASLGLLGRASATTTMTLAPALLLALFAGERLHRRVDERSFRPLIYVLLLVAGSALGARVLFHLGEAAPDSKASRAPAPLQPELAHGA
jgi:uncharacterized membrane protein YfcA